LRNSNPLKTGVHIKAGAPQETDKGHTKAFGQLDRQAAGGGDRTKDRGPCDATLLQQFIAGPPADKDDLIGERQRFVENAPPNQFVQRIVATHIFAHRNEFTRGAKEGGRMETTGAIKELLGLAQGSGQGSEELRCDL